MALKKCAGCGKEMSDKIPFCLACGYPLHVDRVRLGTAASFTGLGPNDTKRFNFKESKLFSMGQVMKLLMMCICVFVILAAVFLYASRTPIGSVFTQKIFDWYLSLRIPFFS